MSTVYLNGELIPKERALVPVDDRGFLFADGIYEVTPAYQGVFFRLERHLDRIRRGLAALRIDFDPEPLAEVHRQLLAANGLEDEPITTVYVQVTRGVAPRAHAFPTSPVRPTVYAFATEFKRAPREAWEKGYQATMVPDRRWARCDIKAIALLPNCLAIQAAAEAGSTDALFVRDGVAIEGAHNNFFAVLDGTVVTHPATNHILHGITREYVLELCHDLGLPVEQRPHPARGAVGGRRGVLHGHDHGGQADRSHRRAHDRRRTARSDRDPPDGRLRGWGRAGRHRRDARIGAAGPRSRWAARPS